MLTEGITTDEMAPGLTIMASDLEHWAGMVACVTWKARVTRAFFTKERSRGCFGWFQFVMYKSPERLKAHLPNVFDSRGVICWARLALARENYAAMPHG